MKRTWLLFRWAFRELFRNWRLSSFFVINMALGLTGFVALESYKTGLQNHIVSNQREILGADLAVSARRKLSEEEKTAIQQNLSSEKSSVVTDFFAMLAAPGFSRLVLVKAADTNYPLYGKITSDEGKDVHLESGGIWLDPELRQALQVKVNDVLKLGQASLTVRGFIGEDSTQTFRAAGLAPRSYISREDLAATGLIQFGSTFTESFLFRLKENQNPDELRLQLYKKLTDPAVQVETAKTAGNDSGRQLKILADFLGLVAIVALFLAALGAAFIWRFFLQQRVKDVAILRSLGLDGTEAVFLYVIEASVLGIAALVPALIAGQALFPVLNRVLSLLTPFSLTPVLTPQAVGLSLMLSLGTSLLVTLPFLLRLREVHPAQLFSEDRFAPELRLRKPWAFLPCFLALWGLAVWQAKSFTTGSLFTGILVGVFILLALGGWFLLKMFAKVARGPWPLKQGLRAAGRRPAASLGIFVALGLGSLLMNVLPQIKVSLQNELRVQPGSKVPALFLFDIQDEQLPPLKDALTAHQAELVNLSPLIRARILKVNGQEFEREIGEGFRTREDENEARFRNRGVNLSYRERLSDSEELEDGRPIEGTWSSTSGKRPGLSVEKKYAERLHLKIGDVLLFDVQGVEIEGEIQNLRKVRWTSFQPNFFILIQDGALNDAPKSWIAGVPRMETAAKNQLQNDLAAQFANISVIDVGHLVTEILKIADQMSWALELMAALSLVTGAVVLFSIARSQVHSRRWELNLLKILGATPGSVRRYLLSEFGLLVMTASFFGAFLSVFVGSLLMWQLFDGGFAADWRWVFGTASFVTFLGLIVAERASSEIIREKPVHLLRGE